MRNKQRIPIVLEKIFGNRNILERWLLESGCRSAETTIEAINHYMYLIVDTWYNNPDLRFGQLLFNLGLTPDNLYHEEECEWLVDKGLCRRQDVTFWGTYGLKPKELDKAIEELKATKPTWKKYKSDKKGQPKEIIAIGFAKEYDEWIKQLPEIEHIPVSKLSTDHIENILCGKNISDHYTELFIKELNFRK